MAEKISYETTEDGESTAKWAFREPGFMGSVKQLICCARCGEPIKGGYSKSRHVRDVLKPTFHCLCDECFEALP